METILKIIFENPNDEIRRGACTIFSSAV